MTFSAQAKLSIKLIPEEVSRFVYEPFTLILEASSKIEVPNVPDGSNYSVTGVFQVPNSGNFRIELIANEAGTLTLPPFRVTAKNETVQTPLLRLPVAAARRAEEMNLSFALSETHLVIDQPTELIVTWKSSVPFTRCQELQFNLPLLRNPAWEVYPIPPDVSEKECIGLPVNTQRVIAKNTAGELSFSYQLIARREGTFRTNGRINCALMETKRSSNQYPSYFDNHFFNRPDKYDRFERIYLSAALPELSVHSLPEEGRTIRYSGIVGACTATATIEPADSLVGQPILLTITLKDLPFGGHIHNLPESTLDGLGPEFLITREPIHITSAETTKAFTYIVRPLRSGLTVLPALTFDTFDPETQTYRTIRTAPLPIIVAPDGKQMVYTPTRKQEPHLFLTGIRNNQTESKAQMNTYQVIEYIARNGWFFWLLPPLLWLALRPALRHRDRCRLDPAYARAKSAARRFFRTRRRDETAAWKGYLADRFNLTVEAVTFETVKPHLQNINKELIQSVHERFVGEETTHYAPPGTPAKNASTARKLVRKLEKALPFLLLLIALLPSQSDAVPADHLFDHAMEIQMEKPDEAQPLFTEAALEFETEERFFNAANSWFFAGENGRALANYRAAEKRTPFNKRISESIAFICAQRTDSFQPLGNSSPNVSNVWKRFCARSPTLRFGVLTLMYLVAWGAYLTARILGKPIRHKIWIIYGSHAAVIALSLVWSFFQPSEGVVIQATDARLGPGYAYEKAYKDILHEAVEFQWLKKQDGWVLARLPDGNEAWLRETACVQIQ